MAYLRKKKTSPYWFACFPSPDGERWLQRSTKSRNKAVATRIALEWERASRRGITEAQARKVLSEIHEVIHDEPLASASVSKFAKGWLARKKHEVAPTTYAVYEETVNQFLAHLRTRANGPISFVNAPMIVAYRDQVAGQTTASTANKKLRVVRNLLGAAWRDGFINENPASKVKSLKEVASARRPFTIDEIKRLLSVANTEWKGLILAGLYTGQRLGDLVRMTWAQIDLDKGEVLLRTQKTGRAMVLPLAKPLREHLLSLPSSDKPSDPVFAKAAGVYARTGRVGNLSNKFRKLLADAGLVERKSHQKKPDGKGRAAKRGASSLTFHSLRHTATSMLKNAGVSEAVARDIIGHESGTISRLYTHVDEESKRAAMAKLPEISA